MGTRPHILIIDPGPGRDGLAARLEALGARCSVARGLHDAMVQCIIRNPSLIVADLSVPGGAGAECRRRLAVLPHFRQAPFLALGPGQDLPETADDDTVAERVRALLPGLGEESPSAEAPPPPPKAPTEPGHLADVLARLHGERADATVTVRASDGGLGEVMLRQGEPVHAVTADRAEGDAALEAMAAWEGPQVEVGPAPRPETPVTVTPAEAPPGPEAAAASDADNGRVGDLLEELEALGVVRRVTP
jgi:hypothetical protein